MSMTYRERRFSLDMWEVEPPLMTAETVWEELTRAMSVVLMILGSVLAVWGCIRETVTGSKGWPEEG